MGLISRVSSRTYRIPTNHPSQKKKMTTWLTNPYQKIQTHLTNFKKSKSKKSLAENQNNDNDQVLINIYADFTKNLDYKREVPLLQTIYDQSFDGKLVKYRGLVSDLL